MYLGLIFTLSSDPIRAPIIFPQARVRPTRQSIRSYQIKTTNEIEVKKRVINIFSTFAFSRSRPEPSTKVVRIKKPTPICTKEP